jgi:hypothetical protein
MLQLALLFRRHVVVGKSPYITIRFFFFFFMNGYWCAAARFILPNKLVQFLANYILVAEPRICWEEWQVFSNIYIYIYHINENDRSRKSRAFEDLLETVGDEPISIGQKQTHWTESGWKVQVPGNGFSDIIYFVQA